MRAAYPLLVCLFLCLAFLPAVASDGSPVQVLYVGNGTNLYTYNIDPQTLEPTLAGTTPYPAAYGMQLASSSNGRFLYFLASANGSIAENRIYVYDTDANGVPGAVVQSLAAPYQWPIAVDPTTKFVYAVYTGAYGKTSQTYFLYRYLVNSATGKLTQRLKVATYAVPYDPGVVYCWLQIAGMNSAGTEIYDASLCNTHGGNTGSYDERSINAQTGALGSPQQLLSWSEGNDGGDSVQFIKGHIFDFASPLFGYSENAIFVSPIKANSKPTIDCNSGPCATDYGIAHPSGKFVFLSNPSQNTTEVDSVDFTSKQIVPTGTVFSNPHIGFFSPDGSLVYASDTSSGTITIFGFDSASAEITQGGTISQSSMQNWLAIERK